MSFNTKSDEEKIRLGLGARMLLESEAVQAVFEDLRENLLNNVEYTKTDNPDEVMPLTRQLRALRVLRGQLDTYVQTGKRTQNRLGGRDERA